MKINLTINGKEKTINCAPGDTLMRALRREGYFSVRFGSDSGETGAAAVFELVSSDVMLAAQADGHEIETVEGLSFGLDLHPIQLWWAIVSQSAAVLAWPFVCTARRFRAWI